MALSLEGGRLDPSASSSAAQPGATAAASSSGVATPFRRVWQQLARAVDRGEALVGGASRPAVDRMDAGTLIALQTGIYRYSEALDLTVKLVDRAATAVRTILESGR